MGISLERLQTPHYTDYVVLQIHVLEIRGTVSRNGNMYAHVDKAIPLHLPENQSNARKSLSPSRYEKKDINSKVHLCSPFCLNTLTIEITLRI